MPSRLAEAIRDEVSALQRVAARARRAAGVARQGSDGQELLWDAVALNLAALYAGVQRTLRLVAAGGRRLTQVWCERESGVHLGAGLGGGPRSFPGEVARGSHSDSSC